MIRAAVARRIMRYKKLQSSRAHSRKDTWRRMARLMARFLMVQLAIDNEEHRRAHYIRPSHLANIDLRFISFDSYFASLDHHQFLSYTRLHIDEFEKLLERLAPRLSHAQTHLAPISARHRLAICLRYLGHGSSFVANAHNYSLGKSTIASVVYECCKAIVAEYWTEAFRLPTSATWWESAAGFERLWGYPRGVGALDGKHFKCIAPPNSGSAHYNFKGTFSVVALIVVDSYYRILLVDCGGKGRISDSGLFQTSPINSFLDANKSRFPKPSQLREHGVVDYHILADGGFGQKQWIQRPFPQAEAAADPRKAHFNECFSSARRIVESVFGIVTSRFRVFERLQGTPDNMKLIIITTMILHNLLVDDVPAHEILARYPPPPHVELISHHYRSGGPLRNEAQLQRLRMCEYFAARDGNAIIQQASTLADNDLADVLVD
ncbi:transposase, IS4 family [Ancylostoma duodenale]|uniref:Transposase, IS4 family n=1 Tax=Ancylostoma duodenale TaxID=51022 RepID=A0A0C2D4S1_9BILA|nr:transposase, IS4 family [Ancylostoma duodenale]